MNIFGLILLFLILDGFIDFNLSFLKDLIFFNEETRQSSGEALSSKVPKTMAPKVLLMTSTYGGPTCIGFLGVLFSL